MNILKDEKTNLGAAYLGVILTLVFLAVAVYSGMNCKVLVQEAGFYDSKIVEDFSVPYACAAFIAAFFSVISFLNSFIIISPNQKVVASFLGKYRGTLTGEGFTLVNPFFSFEKISTKIGTFETQETKINDKEGIPLNVSMVVNYRVDQAAPFHYNAEKPDDIIRNASESELRTIVTQHAFDSDKEEDETLSKNLDMFSKNLVERINVRLKEIGVIVTSANITKISYAPEIAQSMLQRQQAKKLAESRREIVDAAVLTVKDAVQDIQTKIGVTFDDTEKKRLVEKLMVVIVSDRPTTPVISLDN